MKLQADPDDVKSIDAILHALYDVLSGPAGARDWDRMRSLYHPKARLMPVGKRVVDNETGARVLNIEDYIKGVEPFFQKDDFFENQLSARCERFGNIAHVFSTYESRHAKGEPPFQRGINSIQLYFDGSRWWVMSIMWDSETPQQPIPQKYLR